MLATNAEISASATTPAETVIARNVKGGTGNNGLKHRETELLPVPYFHVVFTLTRSIEQNRASRAKDAV